MFKFIAKLVAPTTPIHVNFWDALRRSLGAVCC